MDTLDILYIVVISILFMLKLSVISKSE